MAILPLVIAPDPRLKQKSTVVEAVDDSVRAFIHDLLDTMYAEGGIGLAAVQVGVHKRILVVDVEQRDDGGNRNAMALINPEIIWDSEEENTYNEGCLSFPDQFAEVVRPKEIKVKFLDAKGNSQELAATGLLATCIQHEIDHLDGIVFVDHISAMKRDMIIRKLKKAKKLHEEHHHHHVHGPDCNHD